MAAVVAAHDEDRLAAEPYVERVGGHLAVEHRARLLPAAHRDLHLGPDRHAVLVGQAHRRVEEADAEGVGQVEVLVDDNVADLVELGLHQGLPIDCDRVVADVVEPLHDGVRPF